MASGGPATFVKKKGALVEEIKRCLHELLAGENVLSKHSVVFHYDTLWALLHFVTEMFALPQAVDGIRKRNGERDAQEDESITEVRQRVRVCWPNAHREEGTHLRGTERSMQSSTVSLSDILAHGSCEKRNQHVVDSGSEFLFHILDSADGEGG